MQGDPPPAQSQQAPRHLLGDISGACGDLGTFIPYAVGAMTVAGLAPVGVLFGFGIALVSSGLFYGLPMAVQPMKAVSAVLLTGQLSPGAVAATGLLIGTVLLLLGLTGLIGRMARLIPQSVTAGLQLGLGIIMGWLGIMMMIQLPWIGIPALILLLGTPRLLPRMPVAPLVLLVATVAAVSAGETIAPSGLGFELRLPLLLLPGDWDEVWQALEVAVVPQLPLTLTNAVIVTAVLCRDLFPRGRAAPRCAISP
jgi:predicted benzoate:H+ symporter BenE